MSEQYLDEALGMRFIGRNLSNADRAGMGCSGGAKRYWHDDL